ncbi:IS200/IS605 family transposase [Weeksellaceae bacterium KMM 9713]|uniref:IS200/IS605 family transposase n=1 Tax=Profundicola chukchiensis TaxID=2961959 RepID=A0A9X4RUU8_9FLAO|nr:IS200/IS605 family transposase [Profundicola chukchiensis]MDG4946036.1 IS200/IS605 family transposase [Profundicola chukchiensis]
MANTYTQLYFHVVFAVKGRQNLISIQWKDELYKYIAGIINNKSQKLLIINGMPDHVHLLLSSSPNFNLSTLVGEIKSNSSRWINENRYVRGKFAWQIGFGAFTVSQSQLTVVTNYIKKQEIHHKTKSFREEYIEFLEAYEIDYDNKYIFE